MGQLAAKAALQALFFVAIFYAADKTTQHFNVKQRAAAKKAA
jgi:hypothetical protein